MTPSANGRRPHATLIRRLRFGILLYGALNAGLYAGLLPLWDGFDEPFHYGYVQELSRQGQFPVLGRTVLSAEITQSMDLVPVGYAVRRNVGRGVVFGDYFRMPQAQRQEMKRRLELVNPASAAAGSQSPDYEANQAPLAYLLLAPFDALWARVPISSRVLRLRLLGALVSVLLTWLATFRLARLLQLPAAAALAAVFVVFSSQMFYGAVCHVANDWLAVPLFALLLAEAAALCRYPRGWAPVRLALLLGAGLITKAYFLAAIPVVVGVLAVSCLRSRPSRGASGEEHPRVSWRIAALSAGLTLAISAPWYARNLLRYHNLTGMQETLGGTPFGDIIHAAFHLPWSAALIATVRTSLWTGNNSLVALSAKTTGAMVLLLLAAAGVYAARACLGRVSAAELVVAAGVFCFAAALVYSAVLTFWSTRGAGFSPAPWYVQALLSPAFCLLFLGLSEAGWAGRVLQAGVLWLWGYVMAITYLVKLIPFYAGFTTATAHLSDLPHWYASFLTGSYGALDTSAMVSPRLVLPLAAVVVIMAAGLAAALSSITWRRAP